MDRYKIVYGDMNDGMQLAVGTAGKATTTWAYLKAQR